jgi:hypothetical protein
LAQLGVLEAVILRCLQKRPEARYADLAELLGDLEQRLPDALTGRGASKSRGGLSLLADELELPSVALPSKRWGARLWPLAVVLLAFALGGAVVLATRGPSSERSANGQASAAPAAPPTVIGAPVQRPAADTASTLPAHASAPATVESSSPTSTNALPARKPSRIAPQRSGSGAEAPRSTTPGGSAKAQPAKKRGLGSSEIIDPWAH